MKITVPLVFAFAVMQFMSARAVAHSDMIGPLLIVEKVYGAPAPIGRINRGQLSERTLKQFVPFKDRHPRVDLPQAEADYIRVIYEKWPLDSRETAEEVLARALKKLESP